MNTSTYTVLNTSRPTYTVLIIPTNKKIDHTIQSQSSDFILSRYGDQPYIDTRNKKSINKIALAINPKDDEKLINDDHILVGPYK